MPDDDLTARPFPGRAFAWLTAMVVALVLAGAAHGAEAPRTEVAPARPLTKAPAILWDRQRIDAENPATGGFCGETRESCGACPAGMARGTYRGRTGTGRTRYAYFCCREGGYPVVRRTSGIGTYGVCEFCGPDAIRAPTREPGRRGYDCYECDRPGYQWRERRGETVCLSCGAGYDYDARTGLCGLRGPPRPRGRLP